MAFDRIRAELDLLRDDEPGRRFESGFDRTHVRNQALRLTLVTVGVLFMATAMATFWLPGPNFVLVLAGLALVGGQSRFVARALDRVEVAARRWHRDVWEPYERKSAVLTVFGLVLAILVALIAWYAWQRGWIPFLD
ncbi:MAG: hypothetical protein JWM25_1092 [Thermoleophilia bacterium]|nr:hypothetical protein [Thermoleophilia bacterium]MCZ4496509.1 hypothetical protein [Thermoleophilia bacterium]